MLLGDLEGMRFVNFVDNNLGFKYIYFSGVFVCAIQDVGENLSR